MATFVTDHAPDRPSLERQASDNTCYTQESFTSDYSYNEESSDEEEEAKKSPLKADEEDSSAFEVTDVLQDFIKQARTCSICVGSVRRQPW